MLCNYPWIKTESDGSKMVLPCGNCKGCKIAHAREWSFRLLAELSTFNNNGVFCTLTYDNDNVPPMLIKSHLQKFFKRLRKNLNGRKIKYFACGEYGDLFGRPHQLSCDYFRINA